MGHTPEQLREMVNSNTRHSRMYFKERMKVAHQAEQDTKREQRLAAQECKLCFYLRGRMAGQAFTDYQCRYCKETKSHPNTAVPNFCPECAKTLSICVDCGADLDFTERA